jgi:hypothetical protein
MNKLYSILTILGISLFGGTSVYATTYNYSLGRSLSSVSFYVVDNNNGNDNSIKIDHDTTDFMNSNTSSSLLYSTDNSYWNPVTSDSSSYPSTILSNGVNITPTGSSLSSAPIPGSLLLLGSGVFGLIMLRRKRHLVQ